MSPKKLGIISAREADRNYLRGRPKIARILKLEPPHRFHLPPVEPSTARVSAAVETLDDCANRYPLPGAYLIASFATFGVHMSLRAFCPWIGLPLGFISIIGLWPFKPHSAAMAAAGSIIAALGVITLGRPLIRLGYEKWREASQIIDGLNFPPGQGPPEYKAEIREQEYDAWAVQVFGPFLVIIGTLLNGFSGFIP